MGRTSASPILPNNRGEKKLRQSQDSNHELRMSCKCPMMELLGVLVAFACPKPKRSTLWFDSCRISL